MTLESLKTCVYCVPNDLIEIFINYSRCELTVHEIIMMQQCCNLNSSLAINVLSLLSLRPWRPRKVLIFETSKFATLSC